VNRRHSAVLAAALAVITLSSCATFNRNDVAARVDGVSLSNAQLSEIVRSDLYATVLQSGIVNGVANGDAMRNLLDGWLKLQLLEESGAFKTVNRATVGAGLAQSNGASWTSAPQSLRDLLVLNEAASQLRTSGALNTDVALQKLSTAQIYVDPRYGRWDPATASVVPLTS
jgi:hypothetical protein